MTQNYFPLRWESTRDQWWYASPLDWAAANGHYDLVRQLIRIDNNHLINLTSLRRIRRLETVWDDDEQFHDVAKSRSTVAKKLYYECECTKGKNSLLQAGYGGWLLYTAASAGELSFVRELLERNSLLVYGEGEYGVTDIFYAASRGSNSSVFSLIYDWAVSPRLKASKSTERKEQASEIPPAFKWEMMNRAAHAAARGGNSVALKELLGNCTDILALRDKHGSTVLHAAAARGKVEVIKYLASTIDIMDSRDNLGNTALHTAAYRGQLSAVEVLIADNPSSITSQNNVGDTFLHAAISGFSTPAFKRLDRQICMMKKLLCSEYFNLEKIINNKNKHGRSPLHMAIIENVPSEVVQLLMSTPAIDVNSRDVDGVTPLDLLKRKPRTVSSDILIRQLISAGGILSLQNYTARKAIVSQLKLEGSLGSPGACFRISDAELLHGTGIQISFACRAEPEVEAEGEDEPVPVPIQEPIVEQKTEIAEAKAVSSSTTDHGDFAEDNREWLQNKKRNSVNHATQTLKRILQWVWAKEKVKGRANKSQETQYLKSTKKHRGPQERSSQSRFQHKNSGGIDSWCYAKCTPRKSST